MVPVAVVVAAGAVVRVVVGIAVVRFELLRLGEVYGMVQMQALVVSMKEIYGWLLIAGIISLAVILVSYGPVRPSAFIPKWSKIRRIFRHNVRMLERAEA